MAQHTAKYALVGGGLASAKAAEAIRKYDNDGPILIIGSEPHAPYHRPPLSKEYLRGEDGADSLLPILSLEWYETNRVTLLTGTKATGADTGAKTITLDDGDTVSYEKMLVATGSAPKPLDVPGGDGPNVRTLRTKDDSEAIRAHLGQKLILVGGGYIGVEVASDFLETGGKATIIEPTDQLWSKFASPTYGAFLKDKLEAAGAEIILGDEVTEVTLTGVRTRSGRTIDGDFVVAGVGVKPNLEFALAAGLNVDEKKNGILVNEFLETGTPDVWAAGDCAGFQDPVLGKQWRVEHWNNARWHGEIAGTNMAGQRMAYDHVPHFFSQELDVDFKLFGDPQGGKGGLLHGTAESDRFDELYLTEDGKIAMIITVNPPESLMPTLERLTREKTSVQGREAQVADASFDLASLLK